jgi:hypothetical protein
MRDLVVREGLEAMARDAAERFRELVAEGEEIPYEVREPGPGSPIIQYEPLTERFVRDHAGALRELDSFGATCAALESAELAGVYLEEMGVSVPSDPAERAELAGIAFLCRLWMGSTDFSLDEERLAAAIEELEDGGELEQGEIEIAVPLRGFQMPIPRLELAEGAIVAADSVEVPAEARAGDGLGASPWEPTFLAVARIPGPSAEEPEGGAAAVEAFRRMITTLRLFKAGGVALGPHAWTHAPGDRWRRISTGAGRPRLDGYRLSGAEAGELAAFSRALAVPSAPFARAAARRPGLPSALVRAISRFEAGLERPSVADGLNDNLLALRFLLEGAGPANLGLAMRVAALCAEPNDREPVKAVVDRAVGLERELWSGEPAPGRGETTPAETAAELEELTRAILKDAACGHLGSDLRSTADEILLADGLAVGEGRAEQRGATAEWELEPEAEEPELGAELEAIAEAIEAPGESAPGPAEAGEPERQPELWMDTEEVEVSRPVRGTQPESASEIEEEPVRARPEADNFTEQPTRALEALEGGGEDHPRPGGEPTQSPVLRLIEQTKAERKAHHERVAGLFPPPETTEWSVREVAYDRTRRAEVP